MGRDSTFRELAPIKSSENRPLLDHLRLAEAYIALNDVAYANGGRIVVSLAHRRARLS